MAGMDILSHATRRAVFERIVATPGASIRDLARAVAVTDKTVLHHARVLEGAGLVVVGRAGNRTCCYRTGDAPRNGGMPPELAAVLRAVAAGAVRPSEVARAVGVPRGTAWGQLATLQRLGLLTTREGRWMEPRERFSRE
jgi:predicted transcriptional regulator